MDEDLRAYLHYEGSRLANLPAMWTRASIFSPADDLIRELLVWHYDRMADTKPWAWEGLGQLLTTLRARKEEIHPRLHSWALDVASGRRTPPRPVGRKANDERDARFLYVLETLQGRGVTRADAIRQIAQEYHLSTGAVITAVRRAKQEGLRV